MLVTVSNLLKCAIPEVHLDSSVECLSVCLFCIFVELIINILLCLSCCCLIALLVLAFISSFCLLCLSCSLLLACSSQFRFFWCFCFHSQSVKFSVTPMERFSSIICVVHFEVHLDDARKIRITPVKHVSYCPCHKCTYQFYMLLIYVFYKHLASLLSDKWDSNYADDGWV